MLRRVIALPVFRKVELRAEKLRKQKDVLEETTEDMLNGCFPKIGPASRRIDKTLAKLEPEEIRTAMNVAHRFSP